MNTTMEGVRNKFNPSMNYQNGAPFLRSFGVDITHADTAGFSWRSRVPAKDTIESFSPANILLVGSTGSGKSTFGNWLLNFSTSQIFKEGEDMQPATQAIEQILASVPLDDVESRCTKHAQIRIIDTPGLNEPDPAKDAANMSQLLKIVHDLKYISLVVLCIPYGTRMDSQTEATLKYYESLLSPLFHCRDVCVVITKTPPRNYKDIHKKPNGDKLWKAKIQGFHETIQQKLKYTLNECMIYYVDCKPSEKQSEKLQNDGIVYFGEQGLTQHSAIMRCNLLSMAEQLRPPSMSDHPFPLPPSLERERETITCSLVASRKLDALRSSQQDTYSKLKEEESSVVNKIVEYEVQLRKLQATKPPQYHFTGPYVAQGDNWIGGSVQILECSCPVNRFYVVKQLHNCNITHMYDPDKQVVVVKVEPAFVHISTKVVDKQYYTWYARIKIEYFRPPSITPDEVIKQEELVTQIKALEQLRKIHQVEIKRLEELSNLIPSTVESEYEKYKLLLKENFLLSEVPEVLVLLNEWPKK